MSELTRPYSAWFVVWTPHTDKSEIIKIAQTQQEAEYFKQAMLKELPEEQMSIVHMQECEEKRNEH